MTWFSVRLYATGDLADELAAYQAKVSKCLDTDLCLPYCALLDDFEPQAGTAAYVKLLDSAIVGAPRQSDAVVEVVEPCYTPEEHALLLSSPWVEGVARAFRTQLQALNHTAMVRHPFRMVLALPQGEAGHGGLLPFSDALDWSAKAGWDLQLGQHQEGDWRTEASWPIQQP